MKWRLNKRYILRLSLCFLATTTFFYSKLVFGQTASINATVKLSICGNDLVESGEDCEGSNLGGKTCVSLGYGGGTPSCDIACSLDVSDCTAPAPTPTSIPTSTASSSSSSSSSSSTSTSTSPTSTPTPRPTVAPLTLWPQAIFPKTDLQTVLPDNLKFFDFDKNGRLDESELFEGVKSWVEWWKIYLGREDKNTFFAEGENQCDINGDRVCTLGDFSILLYYVRR